MVKTYGKYVPAAAFGLVCSSSSNSQYDGKLAYVPALEDVLVWDVKKGTMVSMWHEISHTAEVTSILESPNKGIFAVGYADGSVRLWNASSGAVVSTFNGHKKSITALAFNQTGTRLASGSQDTDLIVWDVVAEVGVVRLRGHRDQITAMRFIAPTEFSSSSTSAVPELLLTASKDTFVKLWDLSMHHCIQTLVAHRSEVWTMDVNKEQDLIFTGSSEGELKAWKIDHGAILNGLRETETGEVAKMILPLSALPLASKHRVSQIAFHPSYPFLAVQSHDRSIEIFRIRSEDEILKKQARRKKRMKEKKQQGKGETELDLTFETRAKLDDVFTPYLITRASGKIRSFDFGETSSKGTFQLMTALSSNTIEIYSIPLLKMAKSSPEATRAFSIDLPGHRTDVRTLSLSSDDELLASASNGSLKVWNMKTNVCIRTLDCGFAVSSTFLPGDRHVAIGTKSGEILIYDIPSSTLIETLRAHTSTVWSLHVRPDEQVLASGGADKDVKFWEILRKNTTEESIQSTKLLSLVHTKTLKMTDDVLAVRYSPNQKFLAISLLDSTIKVFYQDSLKFFLSLYGHKLPALSMDISHDSKLMATCSADKNVKIWGLDFGDCHKSIFAHDESVMQVAFEKDSHCFWTAGKDKTLKYWDGDKFEHIQSLRGHHGEIWALAVSHRGKFVVTGSHDKSIRVWDKDEDDQIFLEEERERELEMLYENDIANSLNRVDGVIAEGAEGLSDGVTIQAEAVTVSKQTTETLMAGERIMEAIDLADKELISLKAHNDDITRLIEDGAMRLEPPPRNQLLVQLKMTPDEYVLWVIEKIQSTALQDALLVLPFEKVVSLMAYMTLWAQKDINIPLVCRVIIFLLNTHHHQIVANRVMRSALMLLRKHLRAALQKQREMLGYNLAAFQYIRRRSDTERTAQFYEDGMDEEKLRKTISEGKKRKRVDIRV